jgi:putative transposase
LVTPYENTVIESFWTACRPNCRIVSGGSPRIELANAIFAYLEIFHNRQRRHSALGWQPAEYEKLHATDVA